MSKAASFTTDPTAIAADAAAGGATLPAGSTGPNDPQKSMYGGFTTGTTTPTRTDAAFLETSLKQNVYDPHGPSVRPEGGRKYRGGWVDPYDTSLYGQGGTFDPSRTGAYMSSDGLFKYNQFFMTFAQNFDPFMQKKEAAAPHWWLNRIPRMAYPLFSGTVQETRIYRGGLSIYGGLADWQDLAGDPTSVDACAPMDFKTYQYAWETLAWSGKKTAWGSDPICIEVLKYTPKAAEQLGWILETGVKFGTAIQNIWNRDMFIYQTVMAQRSYVMTNEYRGAGSPRYVYQPFCHLDAADTAGSDLHAEVTAVTGSDGKPHPFILIDASAGIEPLNFDVLDIVRNQLKRRCPEAAVGRIGSEPMFAIAVAEEDVEKYIRGNEEERKYWIEANPQALIQHYGFAPTTFRRWTITSDDDQLRFKLKTFIPKGTSKSELAKYGNVGVAEFTDGSVTTVPLWVAVQVDPEYAGRAGVNGSPVPVPNPEYDMAEIAIAPIFMNRIFVNQFVPDATNLGSGTWFGPKKGLNGKWSWRNFPTKENPDQKIGNFYGEFQIVPKPDVCVYDCISFVYRRCAEPLPSVCPVDNAKINPAALLTESEVAGAVTSVGATLDLYLKTALAVSAGDAVTIAVKKTVGSASPVDATLTGLVYESLTGTHKRVQITDAASGATYAIEDGAKVEVV